MFNYKEYHPFFDHIDEPVENCPYKIENFENFEDLQVQEEKQQELEKTNEEAKQVIQEAEVKKQELSVKPEETKKVIKKTGRGNNMLCSCINTDLLILIVIGYLVYRFMRR